MCRFGAKSFRREWRMSSVRIRQREVQLVCNGARRAGAKSVEFRLGEAVVIVPLTVDDDEKSTVAADVKATEPEKQISAA
jgi:hypothetical protein